MDIITEISLNFLTKDTSFDNHSSIVDAYYKILKCYGMENITTEEIMDKLDIFQIISIKIDEFGWWDMKIIQTDPGTQYTSKEFQEGLYVRGVRLKLAAPEHQELNVQVGVTWKTLRTITH